MFKILRNGASRVWLIVTAIVLVVMIVANVLLNTILFDIVCQVAGRRRPILAESEGGNVQYFEADFDNKVATRENGEKVNEEVTAEGMILLKNKNNALPLSSEEKKVSVFGKSSVDIVTAGSGSAAGGTANIKGLEVALEEADFEINETLWSFYESNESGAGRPSSPQLSEGSDGGTLLATGETPYASYPQNVKDSYSNYDDAAIVVISRLGGESWDLPTKMTGMAGAKDDSDHYLELDANETKLIEEVGKVFDKVIVLLNTATTMEVGGLENDENVDAILWIGHPGDTGIRSLGKILTGEVNPSGRTVDTFVRDFKKDPTWQNFGDNLTSRGGLYTNVNDKDSSYTYAFVDYEEGVYLGYKYYETRALDEEDGWYEEQVVYPFGYGLSYTTFTQTIVSQKPTSLQAQNGTISLDIEVEVTNNTSVAGKDTVQVYVTAPVTDKKLEKSHVVLAGFAKTPLIAGNGSARVTVTVDLYDVASYDQNNKYFTNGGYVLEPGDYTFRVNANSHTTLDSFTANLANAYKYESAEAISKVENRFADADDELYNGVMSRFDWENTFPQTRTAEEKNINKTADTNAKINSREHNNTTVSQYTQKPTMGKEPELDEEGNKLYNFRSLVGKSYDDPLWDTILDMITYEEMTTLINSGAFKTSEVKSIDKAETIDADGPAGFADFMGGKDTSPIYEVTHYCCEPLMAATFNVELMDKIGKAVGNEALVGSRDGIPYSGWYAPGMNIHRSPFGGRAGEYFSEDPFLSGMMGAYEIKGAMSKGVYTQVKHFAVNEQETSRSGVCTWLDEQTLREVYLRPFEKAVKIGGTRGMMSSFNRIGTVWTGGDYRLLTEVLRNEWGFRGMVICDYDTHKYMDNKQAAYAGGDLGLNGPGQDWNPSKGDTKSLNILRLCTKNILYTTVNSNLMNAEVLGYNLPYWQIALYVADVVLAVAFAAWGFFAIRKAFKEED